MENEPALRAPARQEAHPAPRAGGWASKGVNELAWRTERQPVLFLLRAGFHHSRPRRGGCYETVRVRASGGLAAK